MDDVKYKIEVMNAYVNGKSIQSKSCDSSEWVDDLYPKFDWVHFDYRVNNHARQFKNDKECWEELFKHNPIGYLKNIKTGYKVFITGIYNYYISADGETYTFREAFSQYVFEDGSPFGIMTKKEVKS